MRPHADLYRDFSPGDRDPYPNPYAFADRYGDLDQDPHRDRFRYGHPHSDSLSYADFKRDPFLDR